VLPRPSVAVFVLAIVLSAASLIAHPGTGIVRDSRGNVYYTDLARVWMIAPSGERMVIVSSVHTHELYIDSLDNLYGEHLWYEGDHTGRWGHRVWRRSPDGTLIDLVPARQGFRDDHDEFHFDRDGRGRMYWIDRDERSEIRRREIDGRVTTLAHNVQRPGRMTVTPDGTVYYLEADDLLRIDASGRTSMLARGLKSRRGFEHVENGHHKIMGLWTDPQERVYVAMLGYRVVLRVDRRGEVVDVVRSSEPWGPTGGLIDPSGDLWLLESSDTNAVRVRRIRSGQTVTLYGP
jgi:hypothetical protein